MIQAQKIVSLRDFDPQSNYNNPILPNNLQAGQVNKQDEF